MIVSIGGTSEKGVLARATKGSLQLRGTDDYKENTPPLPWYQLIEVSVTRMCLRHVLTCASSLHVSPNRPRLLHYDPLGQKTGWLASLSNHRCFCKPGEPPSLTVKPNSLFSNNNQPQQPTTTQQQQPIDLNHSFLRISLFCSVRKPFPAQGGGPPRNTKRDVFETVWYRSDSVYAVSTASSRLRNRKQHCLITDGLCLPVGQIVMAHKACSFKTQSLNGTKHMDEETTTSPNGGYSYHDTLQTG